jgi:GlpG protein
MTEHQNGLVTFSQKRAALAFSDYLKSQGMPNHLQEVAEGFAVILENSADSDRALAEAQSFIQNPNDPKFWQASWQTGDARQKNVYADEPADTSAKSWWKKAGWVTRVIAFICIAIYGALAIGGETVFQALRFPDAISLQAVAGEWWRLLTPAFLHFGLLHIAFNLLWWWELGSVVERAQSSWRLLAITLVIALVSNGAQFLSYGSDFGGLSAVVYGLLGYLWLYPYADPSAGFRINGVIVAFMLGWLAVGYTGLLDPIFGPVSNDGHLSGLLVGSGLAIALGLVNRKPMLREE